MDAKSLDTLPADVKAKLGAMVAALKEALGHDLESVVVHGSAVRGGFVPGRSDVDVLIVLRQGDRKTLQKIDNALWLARTSARIESMLLVSDEIARSADVFPLLFDDIRRQHVVLHGRDPFADLIIADAHRRLRIEQELREARIRARLLLAEANRLPRHLRGAVARKIKQLRSPLHALMLLKGRTSSDSDIEAVYAEACRAYGADTSVIFDVESAPEAAYDELVKLLDSAIDDVDRMETR